MPLQLIPLDYAVSTVQAYVAGRDDEPLSPGEVEAAAELLERCIRTGEVLLVFVRQVAGPPSPRFHALTVESTNAS